MRTFDQYARFGDALDNPEAGALLQRTIPEILNSSLATALRDFPLGGFLRFALAPDTEKVNSLLEQLAVIEDRTPLPEETPAIHPRADYETADTPQASAVVTLPTTAFVNKAAEIIIDGPSHRNPFVDVEFSAQFTSADESLTVGGFYDGDGSYVLRFLPPVAGTWAFTTMSNARSLDGISATLAVAPSDAPGPVRVGDQYGFAYRDGTPFTPIGTTAYAWTHQPEALQNRTVETLADAPFNKLRMGLFPKHFMYNSNEPADFVFPKNPDGSWDTERFDVAHFAKLEARIRQLDELGIQADIILFHPYDRWGFATLGKSVDDRYIRYVVRRLSAFPNVWWSMANEYELLVHKRPEDWDRLAELVRTEDHADHLLSIHNWSDLFDYSAPWATHASIQRGDAEMGKRIDEWRYTWGKPVIVDEFGYDGDLDAGWGNLTSEEVVDRFWSGMVRGGYLTHGETFYRDAEEIWWSKGGTLIGDSVARISFLRRIVEESPTGRIEPLPSDWDAAWGGVKDQYALIYFGRHRPRFRDVTIPEGMKARIEVIDAWNMTIDTLDGIHEGTVRVDLPARPLTAIRLRSA
ncbi:DUF5605 domain-containing protein [Microbacterium sp. X-17]|uniref:DUF5605 domain-containing protein n=1 Tax=Microbacterium sp. X-17 TaxID=3144404 RepID=UPI0031F52471